MSIKTELSVLEEQIKILESAVTDNPSNIAAYFHMGEIKTILGFYLEGLMCFEEVVKRNKDFLKAYIEAAKIYIYKSMYDEAYNMVKIICNISPYSVGGFVLYNKLKEIFKENNKQLEKINIYENFNSSEEELTSFQVDCQLKIGQYEKLIKEYQNIVEENNLEVSSEYSLRILERGLNFNKDILSFYNDLKTKVKKITPEISAEKAVAQQNFAAEEILKEFLKLRSVMHATVFDKKGVIIAQAALKPLYENIDYRCLTENLDYLDKWSKDNENKTNFISFEFADGTVFIHELGENYYFASSGEGVINFGSLKYTFDKNRESLLNILQG